MDETLRAAMSTEARRHLEHVCGAARDGTVKALSIARRAWPRHWSF
jgi:hypothetical protein